MDEQQREQMLQEHEEMRRKRVTEDVRRQAQLRQSHDEAQRPTPRPDESQYAKLPSPNPNGIR